jgi:hypothetical protein
MALKLDLTLQNGLTATDAIWKIGAVTVVPDEDAVASVHVYTNDEQHLLQTRCYTFTYSGGDVVAAATAHLKTLPEFAGAADV